jgi:hypothetical protein
MLRRSAALNLAGRRVRPAFADASGGANKGWGDGLVGRLWGKQAFRLDPKIKEADTPGAQVSWFLGEHNFGKSAQQARFRLKKAVARLEKVTRSARNLPCQKWSEAVMVAT